MLILFLTAALCLTPSLYSGEAGAAPSKAQSEVSAASVFDLSQAYAHPVPFKPSAGHTHITFKNLSLTAVIKIYTVTGQLVAQLEESDGDGSLQWNVTNKDGEALASDVYYYVIENSEQTKVGKILVVR